MHTMTRLVGIVALMCVPNDALHAHAANAADSDATDGARRVVALYLSGDYEGLFGIVAGDSHDTLTAPQFAAALRWWDANAAGVAEPTTPRLTNEAASTSWSQCIAASSTEHCARCVDPEAAGTGQSECAAAMSRVVANETKVVVRRKGPGAIGLSLWVPSEGAENCPILHHRIETANSVLGELTRTSVSGSTRWSSERLDFVVKLSSQGQARCDAARRALASAKCRISSNFGFYKSAHVAADVVLKDQFPEHATFEIQVMPKDGEGRELEMASRRHDCDGDLCSGEKRWVFDDIDERSKTCEVAIIAEPRASSMAGDGDRVKGSVRRAGETK